MDKSIVHDVEIITTALKSRGTNEISGALLGELIRKITPGLDIRKAANKPAGPGALSKFISLYLSATLQKERPSGVDWIYKIQPSSPSASEANPEIWKVFASPNESHAVILDHSDYSLHVRTLCNIDTDFLAGKINSITKEELCNIQERFLISVPDEQERKEIEEALSAETFYPAWVNFLRKKNPKQYKRWVEFRREEIGKVFLDRIKTFDFVDGFLREKLLAVLMSSQTKQYLKNKISKQHDLGITENKATLHANDPETELREIFIKIISNMPAQELRKIQLPMGYVVDAVKSAGK